MSKNFIKRVSDRFDNNFLNQIARENKIKILENPSPSISSIDILQATIENFIIRVPGMPFVFLYVLASESVVTLQLRTQEKTEKALRPYDILNSDYHDLSPVTKAVESGKSVKLSESHSEILSATNRLRRL
ncbi:MAG: hypothetical protein PHQ95_04020 [Candidatus Gracilibacteria bacterium]|nr:hypothetical protein [Candidatus Gracilibacteria bacterium]